MFNICIGTIGFWLIGFAFAFGHVKKFVGLDKRYFASNGFEDIKEDNYLLFVFHVAFALTSSTVVLGALAERTKLLCYIIYSFIHTSILYPIVVAWTYREGGWLFDLGFNDFAGSSTVFMFGGMSGLCGTFLLGERYGKAKVRDAANKDDTAKENALKNSVMALEGSKKFERVISKVNSEYHEAFKEWLLSQTNEFRPYN